MNKATITEEKDRPLLDYRKEFFLFSLFVLCEYTSGKYLFEFRLFAGVKNRRGDFDHFGVHQQPLPASTDTESRDLKAMFKKDRNWTREERERQRPGILGNG